MQHSKSNRNWGASGMEVEESHTLAPCQLQMGLGAAERVEGVVALE